MKIRRTGATEYGRWIKALVVGESGAGKTRSSSTWPNPLIASAEGGLMSIADRNVPYVEVKSSLELLGLKNSLDQDPDVREKVLGLRIDTVVIDTIDEIQRLLIRERLEETKKETLALADWGWLGEQMTAMIRGFRNLEMHVVFCCHSKETTDQESGRMFFKPGLQGAIADQIPAYVDLSLLLRTGMKTVVEDGETKRELVRVFQTEPDINHTWVKDRSGRLPPEIPVTFEDDFKRIYDAIFSEIDALPESSEAEVTENELRERLQNVEFVEPEEDKSDPFAEEPAVEQVPVSAPETEPTSNGEVKVLNGDKFPLDDGLKPQPQGHGTDFYCQDCGKEIETTDQKDITRIRWRRLLDKECASARKK